ncbi:MAG: hypothetical protein K0S61_4742 [Anaerocolumna sp.]|jgi:hypothetical protein|nr:hypothetical protein [Anaerocolumna sp.]
MRKIFFVILLSITIVIASCGCSQNKNEVRIGFEFNTFEKDSTPYTEVIFKFLDKKEERISVGSFIGTASMIESFENQVFFNEKSLIGCQVFYAGGGDNIFVYLEDKKLIVKHIEFVLGNDEVDSSIIKEEIVTTKEISEVTNIQKYE